MSRSESPAVRSLQRRAGRYGHRGHAAGDAAQAIVTADFNGDGWLDLATANYYYNSVSVLAGNGDGTFQPAQNSAADRCTTASALAARTTVQCEAPVAEPPVDASSTGDEKFNRCPGHRIAGSL